jgi:hypothetical protein
MFVVSVHADVPLDPEDVALVVQDWAYVIFADLILADVPSEAGGQEDAALADVRVLVHADVDLED